VTLLVDACSRHVVKLFDHVLDSRLFRLRGEHLSDVEQEGFVDGVLCVLVELRVPLLETGGAETGCLLPVWRDFAADFLTGEHTRLVGCRC